MSQTVSPLSRSPFPAETDFNAHRDGPIPRSRPSRGTTPKQDDRMEITPPRASPRQPVSPSSKSPKAEPEMPNATGKGRTTNNNASNTAESAPVTNGASNSNNTLSAAAAATSSQPKVVQTAFIHKLYNMLEDQSIRHLISWSNSNESFVMSPSQEFSKVLSHYFKHTNISSFVRQLNMYGFHKVSDVFHTGAPDSALWEFKHGQGNFKRGDLNGLREIRRRASRHTLIHRESFSSPHRGSVSQSQPATPAEPLQEAQPPADPRFAHIDSTLYDVLNRLARTEESNSALSARCAYLTENLARCQQWSNDMAQLVMRSMPDQNSPVYRDMASLQKDISQHCEMVRALDESHESLGPGRPAYFGQMDSMPLSPRQAPQEERRSSLHGVSGRSNAFRPPPPQANLSPRRYGSIGNHAHAAQQYRPAVNVQPPHTPTHPPPHPLASVAEPGHGSVSGGPTKFARRHTSADIRDTAGWPPQAPPPPSQSNDAPPPPGPPHHPWPPSSPTTTARPPPDPQAQHIRETLGGYTFGARRQTVAAENGPARHPSPPSQHNSDPVGPPPSHQQQQPPPISGPFAAHENGWNWGAASGGGGKPAPRFPPPAESAPATRRSSMANLHNLLNPTAGGGGGDRGPTEWDDDHTTNVHDDRHKRQRVG